MIEDGRISIHWNLKIKDPIRPPGCIFQDPECIVSPEYQCDQSGVVYKIQCTTCLDSLDSPDQDNTMRYIGMTRTSVHSRMLTHLSDRRAKKQSSPMYRHDRDVHDGHPQRYVTSIVSRERKIVRLNVSEAITIEKQPQHLLINERNEGGRGGIVRITATRVSSWHPNCVPQKFQKQIPILTLNIPIQYWTSQYYWEFHYCNPVLMMICNKSKAWQNTLLVLFVFFLYLYFDFIYVTIAVDNDHCHQGDKICIYSNIIERKKICWKKITMFVMGDLVLTLI